MWNSIVIVSITTLGLLFVSRLSSAFEGTRLSESDWVGKPAPELTSGEWINAEPTTLSALRGKVVLLEFWTFGCSNCRNTVPYMKKWYKKYAGEKFEIIGVHTPEFATEKVIANVKKKTAELGIEYPVVVDNDYKTWNAYHQQYWPVIYLIDKKGIIRYVHIGEGRYDETDREIQMLIVAE